MLLRLISIIVGLTLIPVAGVVGAEKIGADKVSIDAAFPLARIAGLSGKDVEPILGKAKWEKTKYGPKGIYLDGAVEIVFIKNKADWITIFPTKPLPFKSRAVGKYLGLGEKRPSFENRFTIRWEKTGGFLQVQASPNRKKGSVDMLYIKVATK